MVKHYVYLPDITSSNFLTQRELRHLKVLRVSYGEKIRVLDGKGSLYEGIFVKDKVENLSFIKKEERFKEIILIQSLIKPQKIEFLIQKATEIGLSKIIFVPMKRSNVSIDVYIKRQDRFNKILIDAIKQSHNLFLPKLSFASDLNQAISQLEGEKICFYEKSDKKLNFDSIKKDHFINYLIGPEGGIAEEEIEFLKDKNFVFSKLSKNILRAETAAIYALSIIDYHS